MKLKFYLMRYLLTFLVLLTMASTMGLALDNSQVIDAGTAVEVNMSPGTGAVNYWAGIYGNITSRYVVGNSSSAFFSWDMVQGEYVYAASEDLNFSGNWASSNLTYLKDQYPFIENTTEDVSDTFDDTGSVDSKFADSNISSIAAKTFDEDGNYNWETIYLYDGDSGFFAGPVRPLKKAYNGELADYQMVLPEDGVSDTNATEYNLYVEVR